MILNVGVSELNGTECTGAANKFYNFVGLSNLIGLTMTLHDRYDIQI
jgi:hypothetical protein